ASLRSVSSAGRHAGARGVVAVAPGWLACRGGLEQTLPSPEMSREDVTFTPATAADLPVVRALLEQWDLPVADLTPAHLDHDLVGRARGRIVGVVGLEIL